MSFPRYPKYKPSGVEWLGEVPEHWEIWQSRRLFSLRTERAYVDDEQLTASQKHGVIPQKLFMEIEDQRVVQVLLNSEILKHVEQGDFVISMRSFQGGIEYASHRGCISSAYVMLVPTAHIEGAFFKYLFKSLTYIQALQSTTNLVRDGQALRFQNFCLVPLPRIPIAEQLAIATFLDRETSKIDALVGEQRRLIELLKEKRQAVISHAVTKGLNPHAPMKPSGIEWLGDVPVAWEVCNLNRALLAIGDIDHYMPESVDEGIPYVMTGDLKEFARDIVFERCKQVSRNEYFELTKKIKSSKGDIVLARYATIGTVSYIDVDREFLVSYSCVTIKPNPSKALGLFLFYFFKSIAFIQGIQQQVNANTQDNIGNNALKKIKITLPNLTEQAEIIRYLEIEIAKLDALTAEAERAIELLQERRTALISAAVTGKIDIRSLDNVEVVA